MITLVMHQQDLNRWLHLGLDVHHLGQKTSCFLSFCSSFDEERPEVPMLFRDVPSLLIIFVLTMPQPLRKGMASKAAS